MCIEVNLSQPLIPHFWLRGKYRAVEYEGIHLICFECGCYRHRLDTCVVRKGREKSTAAHHGVQMGANGNDGEQASKVQENIHKKPTVPEVEGELNNDQYGPWMIAKRNRNHRRGRGTDVNSGGMHKVDNKPKDTGSRFVVLQLEEITEGDNSNQFVIIPDKNNNLSSKEKVAQKDKKNSNKLTRIQNGARPARPTTNDVETISHLQHGYLGQMNRPEDNGESSKKISQAQPTRETKKEPGQEQSQHQTIMSQQRVVHSDNNQWPISPMKGANMVYSSPLHEQNLIEPDPPDEDYNRIEDEQSNEEMEVETVVQDSFAKSSLRGDKQLSGESQLGISQLE